MTITTSKFISQLEASVKKIESLVQSLQCSSFHPSQKQYQTLTDLSLRLDACGTNLPIQVAALKNRRAEPSYEEGRKLVSQAKSEIRDLIANAKLENRIIFARNITYFFDGQKDSVVDSDATKLRKQLTRKRCERIRTLSPDGLISWAVAFMPTTWIANLMSKDTFDYVFEHIEPDDYQVWPSDIYYILSGLGAEEPLRESYKYHEFLKSAEDDKKKAQNADQPRKRRRVSGGAASQPSKENREMKYMYTNAPARNISKMPEPFKTAIQNSRLWKWERSQNMETTGCWPSLFPKDHTQDVSFTIWCSNENGENLADFFGSQLEISS
ncbi:hypothetical protein BGZ60DRAFT_435794 [Tricladium varicosporioides]|nr:hypothetical protein BGZ60DRAFT_435794 [Hymenoscyphus varicosporioides]